MEKMRGRPLGLSRGIAARRNIKLPNQCGTAICCKCAVKHAVVFCEFSGS